LRAELRRLATAMAAEAPPSLPWDRRGCRDATPAVPPSLAILLTCLTCRGAGSAVPSCGRACWPRICSRASGTRTTRRWPWRRASSMPPTCAMQGATNAMWITSCHGMRHGHTSYRPHRPISSLISSRLIVSPSPSHIAQVDAPLRLQDAESRWIVPLPRTEYTRRHLRWRGCVERESRRGVWPRRVGVRTRGVLRSCRARTGNPLENDIGWMSMSGAARSSRGAARP
jgi:hypothetical protein